MRKMFTYKFTEGTPHACHIGQEGMYLCLCVHEYQITKSFLETHPQTLLPLFPTECRNYTRKFPIRCRRKSRNLLSIGEGRCQIEKEIEKVEKAIAAHEDELHEVDRQLASPDTYCDGARAKALAERRSELECMIEDVYQRWDHIMNDETK